MMQRAGDLICEATRVLWLLKGWEPGDLGVLYVPHPQATGPPGWNAVRPESARGTLFYRHLGLGDVTAEAHTPEPFDHKQVWSAILDGMTRIEDVEVKQP